ncbi:MAG TPA: alpha/beta fold hydrolase [Acidobacteriota bacterium]
MKISLEALAWTAFIFASLIAVHPFSSRQEDPATTPQSQGGRQAASAGAFLRLVEHSRVPLAPKVDETTAGEGWKQFHFSFSADSENRVPGVLLTPTQGTGKRPVVIVLHGTGSSKERQISFLKDLVGRGFIAVAIDTPYHGERAPKGRTEYVQALIRAYMTSQEHPFLYQTVWDVMRLVDYLSTRSDADASRVGLIGFSKGGVEAHLTAAVDPRIAVTVSCIGTQSFRWSLEHNTWGPLVDMVRGGLDGQLSAIIREKDPDFVRNFLDRVVPGIYDQFDATEMLPLIAPRPLMLINGDSDPLTPLSSVMECVNSAKKAYAQSHAEDKFVLRIQEKTGHSVTPASRRAAIDWFAKWMKPETVS